MSTSSKADKQYGLIIPKKQQLSAPQATNVFADDNGSDEEDGTDWVKKALKAEGEKNKMKKQTKLSMQKALKEDPTIYQYDEVYDDMEHTKIQSKIITEEKKKPKYIENLLKAAERRKKEQEHRIERMVQKEREAEGTMFADKESFVTSAYRAKLEEFKQMEEEESRMDRLEAIADVTKQQDMSGFYRHLYEQTVECPKQAINPEEESKNSLTENVDNVDKDTMPDKEPNKVTASKDQTASIKIKRSRQYRQRVIEADESDTETIQEIDCNNVTSPTVKSKNTDETDIQEPDSKRPKEQEEVNKTDKPKKDTPEGISNSKNADSNLENSENDKKTDKPDVAAKAKIAAEKKEKSRIWEKRTVGPQFEAALERYYARKAIRQCSL